MAVPLDVNTPKGWLGLDLWDTSHLKETWYATTEDQFYLLRLATIGKTSDRPDDYLLIVHQVEESEVEPRGMQFRRYGVMNLYGHKLDMWVKLELFDQLETITIV